MVDPKNGIKPDITPSESWYRPGDGLEESYYSSDAEYPEGHPSNQPLSDSDLSKAESEASEPDENKNNKATSEEKDSLGVNDDDESDDDDLNFTGKGSKKNKGGLSITKKRGLIGGGIAGTLITVVFAFTSLLPLKILGIANNLQDRFFASSNTMFDKYSDKVFSHYIKKHVLSGMGREGCKSTLTTNASCLSVVPGDSKLSRLYRSWSENNLETKLAKDYGLVFEKTGVNGSIKMRVASGGSSTDLDITGFESSDKNLFEFITEKNPNTTELSRNELRQIVRSSLANETGGKKLAMRFKLGKLLERKYGIKRCVVACKSRNDFSDWKNNKTKAYKLALIQRIVEPKSDMISGVMKCVIEGCEPTSNIDADGVGNGEVERNHSKTLDKLVSKLGTESTEDLFKLYSEVSAKGGASSYLIEKGLAKYFGAEVAEKVATKAIPVVGWIDLAVKLGKAAQNAPATLRRTGYVASSGAAATYWMMWRTHADEIKLGYVDAEMVGSFTNTLNGLDTDDSGKVFKPDNGGITMESSPLYQQMFGSNSSKISFLGLQAVNAAGTVPCDNEKTIAAGELNCPEERFNQADNLLLDAVDSFFDNTTDGQAAKIAIDGWEVSGGFVIDALGGVVGALTGTLLDGARTLFPVIKDIEEKLASVAEDLFKWVFEALVPNPFNNIAGNGARSFAMMAAGASHTANTHNQLNLGGGKITNQQAYELQQEDELDRNIAFKNSSLKYRLFNKDDTKSLVSRAAMSMPTSKSVNINNIANMIANPFTQLGSLVTFGSASAQSSNIDYASVFGEESIGIPLDDPVYSSDPETYTDEYCKANGFDKESWAKTAIEDKNTGQFYHTKTNPCILHNTVVESLGAKYDETLLSDLGGSSSASNNNDDSPSTPSLDGPGVGKWSLSPNANRPGADLTPLFEKFLDEMSKHTTFEPIVTTGTNHKMQTSSGNVSDHWAGNGADFGQSINKFGTADARPGQVVPRGDEIAAAALIACGTPVDEAKSKALSGGNHSANCTIDGQSVRIQMIWKSNVGGNHYNHVHVGIKKL